MKNCKRCGGAWFPPNQPIWYAGPVCYCAFPDFVPDEPSIVQQVYDKIHNFKKSTIIESMENIRLYKEQVIKGQVVRCYVETDSGKPKYYVVLEVKE